MLLALVTFYFVLFITAIAFQTLDNRKTLTTAFEHAAEGGGEGGGWGVLVLELLVAVHSSLAEILICQLCVCPQ